MKFNAEHKMIMKTAFNSYDRLVKLEQEDYLERMFQVMSEKKNLISFNRGESDFRDFAIAAYIHNLKNKITEWEEMLAAVKETRNIVDDFDTEMA